MNSQRTVVNLSNSSDINDGDVVSSMSSLESSSSVKQKKSKIDNDNKKGSSGKSQKVNGVDVKLLADDLNAKNFLSGFRQFIRGKKKKKNIARNYLK